jgi:hypothetical protein
MIPFFDGRSFVVICHVNLINYVTTRRCRFGQHLLFVKPACFTIFKVITLVKRKKPPLCTWSRLVLLNNFIQMLNKTI